MSIRVQNTFTWLWIVAVSASTIGFSMQRIYCYCAGVAKTGFFSLADLSCGSATVVDLPDCCHKPTVAKKASCCEKPAKDGYQSHGCTQKTTQVFQLKTEFLVEKPFEKNFDYPLWFRDIPMFRRLFRPSVCQTIFLQKPPPTKSPSGWERCVLHCTARC